MNLLDPAILSEVLWRLQPHTFAERASEGRWKAARHLAYISEFIASRIVKGNARMMLFMPPRHGKSELVSHWLPTWYLENLPRKKVIITAYGAELAEDWGRMVRDEFAHNPVLHTKLKDDSTSVARWHTEEGGHMIAAGVGGPIVGRGGDLLIIDDPYKNEVEAYSSTHRRKVERWYKSTFRTRLEPGGSIILIMHRWHPDDLAGTLLKEADEPWEVIRLPALAEPGDVLGRAPGEPLWPERYDLHALDILRRGDQFTWDGLFQQNPTGMVLGRVYEHFSDSHWPAGNINPAMKLSPSLPLQLCVDFNVNPGMHMIVGQHDPRSDMFLRRWEIHGPRMKTAPAMDEFERIVKRAGGWQWPELWVYGDRSGKTETTNTTDIDYDIIVRKLKAMGIKYRLCVPNANPPVKSRIDTMNDALRDADGARHYQVHPDCVRLIADLRALPTGEDGLIDKSHADLSHASDADGYCVYWCRPIRKVNREPGRVVY